MNTPKIMEYTAADKTAVSGRYRTTVVIPSYNGLRFLAPCMTALGWQSTADFETAVIDNGSSDGSTAWLRDWERQDPARRHLICLPGNLGFSAAVNAGIRYAAKAGSDYVILLNNDTKVHPDFVENLVKRMDLDKEKRIFALSSRMVKMADPSVMDDAGDQYTILGWQFQRGLDEPARDYNTPSRVFSACAGAAIYRTEAFAVTGMFDEKHFAYLEDMDISFRANLYGYRIYYEPSAVCEHVGSGTSGSKYNSFKVKLSARNSLYLLYKNLPLWMLILNLPALCCGFLIKQLYFLRKGFGSDYFCGLCEAFRTFHTLKRARTAEVPLLRFLTIELRMLSAACEYLSRLSRRYGHQKHQRTL